ncbi:MAG: hypothetical protein HW403_727 [Dehalococcoidia bacterium]|nr:hypothetical protein [Dehalococcoidia bacterium]
MQDSEIFTQCLPISQNTQNGIGVAGDVYLDLSRNMRRMTSLCALRKTESYGLTTRKVVTGIQGTPISASPFGVAWRRGRTVV